MSGDVFLVDDNPANLTLLAGILRAQGYKVRMANSGRSALEVVRARAPELILLDITMPEMDGYEVCLALKADPATRAIPVLFISALDDPKDKVKAFQSGGVDYIPKPFQADEVLARVKSHLEIGRLQGELRSRNADLERMNAEKSEFMGIVAHDLKSPLNVIRGYAEMLREEPEMPEPERDSTLARIATAAGRMDRLIQDLLDVNAIERGLVTFQRLPVDIAQVAALVVEGYQESARAKGQTLLLSSAEGDAVGMADPKLLPQLIENLVSNAIKFSPPGKSTTVRVLPMPQAVRLEVTDEGPGLTEEDQGKLFGKFTRLSARPTGGEHSTGLGLSIVKRLVEAMEGRVGCVSTPGAGATFFLEIARS